MNYQWRKLLFLFIPTVAIGLWEFIRHEMEIPYLSHELGHVLGAVLVLFLTVPLLHSLFKKMEADQAELNRIRNKQWMHEQREQLARQLHDGFAQSLFFLSVKMKQLDQVVGDSAKGHLSEISQTVRHMDDDVRQLIQQLIDDDPAQQTMENQLQAMIAAMCADPDRDMRVHLDWQLHEERFDAIEQHECFACLKEALTNCKKHSQASDVYVSSTSNGDQWVVEVRDHGIGISDDVWQNRQSFGLKIMRDRAAARNWQLEFRSDATGTVVRIIGHYPFQTNEEGNA